MAQKAAEPTTQDLFDAIEVIPTDERRPARFLTARAQLNRRLYQDIDRWLGIRRATCETAGLVY
jgi:hypothetical protein